MDQELELKGNYITVIPRDYVYDVIVTVPGKRTYQMKLWRACKAINNGCGRTSFQYVYMFEPGNYETREKTIAPFDAFGLSHEDTLKIVSSDYCGFKTDSDGHVESFLSDRHALLALRLLDKEITKRFGIPQDKNIDTQDKPHRLAGHVRLEFE